MERKEIDKAKELANDTLAVGHRVKHEGMAPKVRDDDKPTKEAFKKGREIADRLKTRDAKAKKPKTKSTAKPRMSRREFRDLLRKGGDR